MLLSERWVASPDTNSVLLVTQWLSVLRALYSCKIDLPLPRVALVGDSPEDGTAEKVSSVRAMVQYAAITIKRYALKEHPAPTRRTIVHDVPNTLTALEQRRRRPPRRNPSPFSLDIRPPISSYKNPNASRSPIGEMHSEVWGASVHTERAAHPNPNPNPTTPVDQIAICSRTLCPWCAHHVIRVG